MAPGKRHSYPEKGTASPEKGTIENTRKNGIFWEKWTFSYMRPRALLKTIINNIKNRNRGPTRCTTLARFASPGSESRHDRKHRCAVLRLDDGNGPDAMPYGRRRMGIDPVRLRFHDRAQRCSRMARSQRPGATRSGWTPTATASPTADVGSTDPASGVALNPIACGSSSHFVSSWGLRPGDKRLPNRRLSRGGVREQAQIGRRLFAQSERFSDRKPVLVPCRHGQVCFFC